MRRHPEGGTEACWSSRRPRKSRLRRLVGRPDARLRRATLGAHTPLPREIVVLYPGREG